MLAYRLEISDESVAQKILNFLATMPKGSVSLTLSKPSLSEELKRRVKEAQENKIKLSPYMDGMDEMMNRLEKKYANS